MTLRVMNKDENMHISCMSILFGRFSEEFGYTKDNHDLNEGAGGRYLYFAFHTGDQNPITDIVAIYGDRSDVGDTPALGLPVAPSGQPYTKLGTDFLPLRSGLDNHVDNAPPTIKINVR